MYAVVEDEPHELDGPDKSADEEAPLHLEDRHINTVFIMCEVDRNDVHPLHDGEWGNGILGCPTSCLLQWPMQYTQLSNPDVALPLCRNSKAEVPMLGGWGAFLPV
mmetsp:Transcript_15160/g.26874  ORF Transcript_15160/g.26874 Transcript_15160/m.26874 type:complete len:106 (-) Transcript_15160:365-682(-)